MREQVFVTQVGLFRRGEAGELAHGPELAAVAGGMNAAGVRRMAGHGQCEIGRQIRFGVEPLDRQAGDGGEAGIAFRVDVDASACADGPLRSLGQRGLQHTFGPVAFLGGWMALGRCGGS